MITKRLLKLMNYVAMQCTDLRVRNNTDLNVRVPRFSVLLQDVAKQSLHIYFQVA
jgi:hypothetical protein